MQQGHVFVGYDGYSAFKLVIWPPLHTTFRFFDKLGWRGLCYMTCSTSFAVVPYRIYWMRTDSIPFYSTKRKLDCSF